MLEIIGVIFIEEVFDSITINKNMKISLLSEGERF
jgi:hypothetical protein